MKPTDDKKLLELAAKAAGIEYGWQHIYDDYEGSTSEKWDWNPLSDDGDALRLAVKLGIKIERGLWRNPPALAVGEQSRPYKGLYEPIVER
jgi:hypothetical protein